MQAMNLQGGAGRPYVHDPASSLGQTYIGPNSMLSPVGALPPGYDSAKDRDWKH